MAMSIGNDEKDTDKIPVIPLEPKRVTEQLNAIIPWRMAPAKEGESCRWACVDGRSVAICIGGGDDLGKAVVIDTVGERHRFDSYEEALEFAKSLRTW